jgi:hypothetical protein
MQVCDSAISCTAFEKLNEDTGPIVSRLNAEAVSVTMIMGLHTNQSNTGPKRFIDEVRHRLFAHVFILDKVGALTTGCPPLLHGRYCSTTPPLDIRSDDNWGQEVEEFDQYGWNIDNCLHPVTFLRARFCIALIRDEILEMALISNPFPDKERLRCDHCM